MEIRTRFAPSPTGYLHIGSVRTALYSWLFAKKHRGQFILRIEDTDQERQVDGAIDIILKGMAWLGLDYNEGPYYQSERLHRYREIIDQLIQEHCAYRCNCSKERLEKLREQQLTNKQKPRYDGQCRNKQIPADTNEPFVIRFKMPQTGEISFDDAVHGPTTFKNSELDDVIILRSDGQPTYNFTVVVDDWDMAISHVIRGDDHINNTPKQIHIFRALGATEPTYAHLPMILGDDGKRLSKRHGACSVLEHRDEGFLPEAILNYLLRLGWSHGDQEIFSKEEMVELFNLEAINRAAGSINPKKLLWLNQQYLKTLDPNYVSGHLAWHMTNEEIDTLNGPLLADVVTAQAERCETLAEMAVKSRYFYEEPIYDPKASEKFLQENARAPLTMLREQLTALSERAEWEKAEIHDAFEEVVKTLEIGFGKLAQPVRVAMTGNTISPPIDITLALIGQERVLDRLDRAITLIGG